MSSEQITIKEAMEITGKSINTIRNWIKAGKVDATKDGKVWLIQKDSLKAASGKKKSKKKAKPKKAAKKAPTQKTDTKIEGYVDVKEASRMTGKAANTIWNWIKAEKVNSVMEGGRRLVSIDSLKAAELSSPTKMKKTATKKIADNKPVQVEQSQRLNGEIAMLKAQLAQVKKDNESLREKEDKLNKRIRRVFGKVLSPMIERLLEIE